MLAFCGTVYVVASFSVLIEHVQCSVYPVIKIISHVPLCDASVILGMFGIAIFGACEIDLIYSVAVVMTDELCNKPTFGWPCPEN